MATKLPVHIKKAIEENMDNLDFSNLPFKSSLSFEPILRLISERVNDPNGYTSDFSRGILNQLEKVEIFKGPIEDESQLEANKEMVDLMMTMLIPKGLGNSELSYVTAPFSLESVFMTQALDEKLQGARLEFNAGTEECRSITNIIIKACTLILDKVYGYKHFFDLPMVFTLVDEEQGTCEYYKSIINVDYVDVLPLAEVNKPDEATVHKLLRNMNDGQLWFETIRPDKFEFRGVIKAQLIDVTEEEAISRMKYTLLEKNALVHRSNFDALAQLMRDYFRKESLVLGLTALDYPEEYRINHAYKIRHDILADREDDLLSEKNHGSIIDLALQNGECMVIDNIGAVIEKTDIERGYLAMGINSVILAPLRVGSRTIGLLEIGTPKVDLFGSLDRIKILDLIPLFTTSLERSRDEIDNHIDAIIREQYTAIHPSVEWKFVEVAYNLLEAREKDPYGSKPESIVFNDVIPLYAQTDIAKSSNIRNRAIQQDLLENLSLAKDVVQVAGARLNLPIIRHYENKIKAHAASIELSINSNDEVQIIEFIKVELGALFTLFSQSDRMLKTRVEEYQSRLDADLGIVYKERKAFEDSVSRINDTVSSYLELKEEEAQKIVPHYFEKYKTDGVEFDMYFGQSLMNSGTFHPMHMRNMRLWQLILMCDIARIVKGLQGKLEIPLSTAQLVLVHSNPLSIRFRVDEKRFDVDGTYNVRYEIIKKRIDKALIMDSRERLTKPGTVSIVYTQDKDRPEYEEYIQYLIEQKYVLPEYDHVELERTQGVEGLKAFRLYVEYDVDGHDAGDIADATLIEDVVTTQP